MPKRNPSYMQAQRERILRATIFCISDVGLEGTSIARICKQAGLSAGAIYKHFAAKDEIIAAALRFAAMPNDTLPDIWSAFRDAIAAADDQGGFDTHVIARAQLQLFASSLRPGPLHDMVGPMVEESLGVIARHLSLLEEKGQIRLKMSALQTAKCISALTDGLLWIGLVGDRPLDAISRDIAAALGSVVDVAE